jgi:hypothetical protein
MAITLTQESLEAFYSPEEVLYRQPLYGPIRYSPGIRYVAEAGEAWWP